MTDATPRPFRPHPLLQLIRPANVATALADVVAGYAVSGRPLSWSLGWLLLSTGCLYAGGIVLNDVFDRQIDALERPERPIPSGKISVAGAGKLGAALLLAGVASAVAAGWVAGWVAAATAAAVLLYDVWGKHHPVLGPVNMGLCRALNLMLGVSAAPSVLSSAWPLGFLPLVYIAAVTMVSRGEVHGSARPVANLALALVGGVIAALAAVAGSAGRRAPLGLVLTAVLCWRVVPAFWRAARTPDPPTLRRAVQTGVLSLVLVDAVVAAAYADMIYSLAVLLTGLVAWRLARLFAVT